MPLLVVLFLAIAAEIAVVIAIGNVVGALWTILLLIAVSMAGVALLRRQGTRTITGLTDALRNRRDPQPEIVDGSLIGVAAALILFPGFVSDLAALFLLFPPTRAVVRRKIISKAAQRRTFTVVDGEVVPEEPAKQAPIVIEQRDHD
jgi:UPF0716 protein FxsA